MLTAEEIARAFLALVPYYLAGAGAGVGGGQIVVVQIPGGLQFPSVRDGRDAQSLVDQLLQQSAEAARLRGQLPGGLMDQDRKRNVTEVRWNQEEG